MAGIDNYNKGMSAQRKILKVVANRFCRPDEGELTSILARRRPLSKNDLQ